MTVLSEERLKSLEARLDKEVSRIERYGRLSEKHLAASKRAAGRGDDEKSRALSAAAFKAASAADLHRARAEDLEADIARLRKRLATFQSERARLSEAAGRFVSRLAARAKGAEPASELTGRERREQLKRARLYEQGERAKRRDLAAANIDYDPRLASGRRDLEIQSLGGGKRARANPHKKLFRNPAEATTERILACERYDELWHAANADQMPAPRFEPGVDTSTVPGVMDGNAYAHQQLTALQRRIGDEATAMLFARVVLGLGYRAMETEGHGDERRLSIAFVQAVDAATRFFGLAPDSRLVISMRHVMASAGTSGSQ